jgi:hypothetical protein
VCARASVSHTSAPLTLCQPPHGRPSYDAAIQPPPFCQRAHTNTHARARAGDSAQLEVLLAPAERLALLPGADDGGAAATALRPLVREARRVRVPLRPPPCRARLEEWAAVWPVSLRTQPPTPPPVLAAVGARMERCYQLLRQLAGTGADDEEDARHTLEGCGGGRGSCRADGTAGLMVDPATEAVLAQVGARATEAAAALSGESGGGGGGGGPPSAEECHPLGHPAMQLIAQLAAQGAQPPACFLYVAAAARVGCVCGGVLLHGRPVR